MTVDGLCRPNEWCRVRAAMAQRMLAGACAIAALVAVVGAPASADAQDWPAKPVRLVVNFPPGSSPDVVGRAVATPALSQALGQPVVVDNRTGAGGVIGADAVAKAPGDGYTLLMSSGSAMTITPHMYPKMPFDPAKDLVPVAAAARIELFLVARNDLPFQTFAEFLKFAKANPGKLTYASPGNGTTPHIAGEMLKSRADIFAVHVPYRGSAPALQDLLGGQVDFVFDPGIALSHVRTGRLRLLAVAGAKRSLLFPDTPTLHELGLKDFDAGITHGFYAPAGTAASVVDRLNREINRILVSPAVSQQIRALGAEPTPMTPGEFRAVMERDSQRYGAIIRQRNIKAE